MISESLHSESLSISDSNLPHLLKLSRRELVILLFIGDRNFKKEYRDLDSNSLIKKIKVHQACNKGVGLDCRLKDYLTYGHLVDMYGLKTEECFRKLERLIELDCLNIFSETRVAKWLISRNQNINFPKDTFYEENIREIFNDYLDLLEERNNLCYFRENSENSSGEFVNLSDFPEIIFVVLNYLPLKDILSFCRTTTQNLKLYSSEAFWKYIISTHENAGVSQKGTDEIFYLLKNTIKFRNTVAFRTVFSEILRKDLWAPYHREFKKECFTDFDVLGEAIRKGNTDIMSDIVTCYVEAKKKIDRESDVFDFPTREEFGLLDRKNLDRILAVFEKKDIRYKI